MRIFVAVEPPRPLQEALAEVAKELLSGVREARLIRPANLHVTVRFLGELGEAQVQDVLDVLRKAAASCRPGTAHMRGLGAFPSASQPRVVWAGVDDPDRVVCDLEGVVSDHLEPCGFPREERPFHPHVTIARMRHPLRGARGRSLAAAIAEVGELGDFPVGAVALMQSRLTPNGAQYSVLESIALTAPPHDEPTTDTPSEAEPGTGEPR